jgi:glucose/arabinose dehydrogenase
MTRASVALLLVALLSAATPTTAQTEIYGTGCGSSPPGIAVSGSVVPGGKAQVSLSGAPPGALVLFLLGTSDSASPWGPLPLDLSAFPDFASGCRLLTSAQTQLLLNAGPQGTLKLPFKLPATLGSDLYAQWAVVQSLSPLVIVMTPAVHICLQTNPDVHAAIVAPTEVVDWDGNGVASVTLDGGTSHTHEPGHAIVSWTWKVDGEPAGSGPVLAPSVALGPHVATLTAGDDGVPPDTALASHAFEVLPVSQAPGALARYYGSGAADPAQLLDAEPAAADFAEVLGAPLVPNQDGFAGGSPYTGQCMVTLDATLELPVGGAWAFATVGGSETRLFVDGAPAAGALPLAAGLHAVEARYALPDVSVLPLTLTATLGGQPQDVAALLAGHDAAASGPVINAITPPDGSVAGGNVVVLDGVGFFPAASTQVLWGDLVLDAASGLDVQPAQITLTTPPHAAGPQVVRVVTPAGASNAASFTYVGGGPATVNFARIAAVAVPAPTSADWGPDGRLYVGSLDGEVRAITFDAAWNAVAVDTYAGVSGLPNANILGVAFNPFDNASSPRLYVGHGWHYADGGGLVTQPSAYWGQVSVLEGPSFGAPQPLVTGLPQPNTGHAVNGLQFDHNGDLLIALGSTSNAGIRWLTMGDLPESPLSAAIAKAQTSRIDFDGAVEYVHAVTGAPMTDQRLGEESLLAPGSHVFVQGAGLRNPYDLVYTTRKKLYATDNGPNAGYGPASTSATTQTGTHPDEPDELLLVESGNYYGSPNRSRGLFDPRQHVYRDHVEPSLPGVFTQTLVTLPSSTDGLCEYVSDAFGGAMRGNLVAQKWLGEARRIELSADGRSVTAVQTVLPVTGALDILPGPGGVLVAVDYSNSEVEILAPVEAPGPALQLLDVTPWRGPASGGTRLVLGVRNAAGSLGSTSVILGGLPAQVLSVSPTQVVALAPPQPAPTTDLLDVTLVSGGQADTLAAAFRYLFVPAGNEPGAWEMDGGGGGSSGGGELPFALSEVAAAALDGKLYVVGPEHPGTWVLDLMDSLVPPLAWDVLPPRPFPGGGHAAEELGGKLYLVGGSGAAAGRVQAFDPASGLWTLRAPLPWPGESVCTAVIGGSLYAAGGLSGGATSDLAARYDPQANAWTLLPPMPLHAGRHHAASGTDGQRLWIFGGYGFGNGEGGLLAPGFDTVQCFDPQAGAWISSATSTLAPLPQPRAGMGRAVFWQGEFYVFGGESSLLSGNGKGVTGRVDAYDPATNAWRSEAPMPTPRHGHGVALFQGRVFVAGGGEVAGPEPGTAVECFTRQ